MKRIYLKAIEINQIYGVPLRTVYNRINAGHYKINSKGEVCTKEVEKFFEEPIKRGRKRKNERP